MNNKKYKTIDEVSKLLNIKKHVIRYWDSKFDKLSMRLNGRKQRFFSHENILKIEKLNKVLYNNGKSNYTLDLANKLINVTNNKSKTLKIDEPTSSDGKFMNIINLKKISNSLKKLL